MKKHLEILKKLKADILSEEPQFVYPQNPRKKIIKEGIKDAVRSLDVAMRPFEAKLEALSEELDKKLEQASNPSTPKTPTRPASPLTFLAFRKTPATPEPASVSPEIDLLVGSDLIDLMGVDQIKEKIAKINSQIDEMFTKSQNDFFLKYPETKSIYALIFADISLFDNHYKGTGIDNLLESFFKSNPNDQSCVHLREIRNEIKGIENTLAELKKNPEANIELIFSTTDQYNQLADKQNNEWTNVRKAIASESAKAHGSVTSPPRDPQQRKSGGFTPII